MKAITRWMFRVSFLVLLCVGCKGKGYRTFEYTFSMETVASYRMTFSFDQDKNYRTEVRNYYMSRKTNVKTGVLTDEQYARLYDLLTKTNLFSFDDSYGFDGKTIADNDLLIQVTLNADGKTKYISIGDLYNQEFPKSFRELVRESITFIE